MLEKIAVSSAVSSNCNIGRAPVAPVIVPRVANAAAGGSLCRGVKADNVSPDAIGHLDSR